MNNKNKFSSVEDELPVDARIQMFGKTREIHSVDVYFDELIADLPYYRNLLQYMREMQPEDELRIWVDSPGGYLASALSIIDAMNSTEGQVTVIVTGQAASAASIIALNAPNLIIGDNAYMMCHSASYGTGAKKQGEIFSQVQHSEQSLRKMMFELYENFLEPEEIEMMLVGRDYYFDYDEITERLNRRQQIIEGNAPALGAEPVVKPKRVRKKPVLE